MPGRYLVPCMGRLCPIGGMPTPVRCPTNHGPHSEEARYRYIVIHIVEYYEYLCDIYAYEYLLLCLRYANSQV